MIHHNVQSLNNKLVYIAMMLTVDNLNMNILCFTEHWLLEDQMNVINIEKFRLESKFCRGNVHRQDLAYLQETLFILKKLTILVV
jgi:hypothetical protein